MGTWLEELGEGEVYGQVQPCGHLIEWPVPNLELKIFRYIYKNKIVLGLLVTMSP